MERVRSPTAPINGDTPMTTHTRTHWIAGDRIGLGNLIAAFIVHLTVPPLERGLRWHENEALMRATLNHITEEVARLPGRICHVPPRPPIQPTDTSQ